MKVAGDAAIPASEEATRRGNPEVSDALAPAAQSFPRVFACGSISTRMNEHIVALRLAISSRGSWAQRWGGDPGDQRVLSQHFSWLFHTFLN